MEIAPINEILDKLYGMIIVAVIFIPLIYWSLKRKSKKNNSGIISLTIENGKRNCKKI